MQLPCPLRRASEHRHHHYRGLYLGVSSHCNTSTVTTALVCQSYFVDYYTCSKLVPSSSWRLCTASRTHGKEIGQYIMGDRAPQPPPTALCQGAKDDCVRLS